MKAVSPILTVVLAGLPASAAFAKEPPSSDRRTGRSPNLWTYYMHGVTDRYAVPVTWGQLFGPDQDAKRYLVSNQPIDTPYRKSTMPALRLVKSASIDLAKPLPMDMTRVRGRTVRVFIWLKGENVRARNNCWHAPGMIVIPRDAAGNVLSQKDAYIQTQGTYPWHCYYTDVFVPKAAAAVYLRLFSKFTGRAFFSSPSWELVTPENTYSDNEMQDPATGSLAFNPRYDEMPYHLKHGTLHASRYPWRFVLGSKIGLVGQPYDVTTKAGFRKYYFEKARKDGEHMNHAILYMGSMYRSGVAAKLLPPMEPGWLENFGQILIEDQDPKTGFWHDGTALSLGLTFHLCNMHFRYREIPRSDRPMRLYPDFDLGLKCVPRAEAIIQTVLRQQSSWVDPQGVRRKAAWNRPAYRYTETPDAFAEKCYLGSTWDAIYLLRVCGNYVSSDLRKKLDDAVKEAFYYVLYACVLDDGVYKQHDTDPHPTGPNYMSHIMEDTAWLERRVTPAIPAPRVTFKNGLVTWLAPAAPANSLRVYAVPEGTPAEKINESFLAGIIQRTGHKIYEMDPFLAVQKIRRATCDRWGGTMDLPSSASYQGQSYLSRKLRMISYPLAFTNDGRPLTLRPEDIGGKDLYVSAADWYGGESDPVSVDTTAAAASATAPAKENTKGRIHVVLVGDSTVADYAPESPIRGWGQLVPEFFTAQVRFTNRAVGGRSSKSFRAEGRWQQVLELKPDYIFIQFGHNDCRGKGPARETDPNTTYRDNLRQYIREARQIGARPVLITPVERRNFGADGKVVASLAAYAEAMTRAGEEEHVPVVDLHRRSIELYERLGEAASADLNCSAEDHTHFSEKGARAMVSLIVADLPVPELRRYLR